MLSTASMGTVLLTVVAFLFVLTVVVFIHELGHFLVARWCGVKVSTFSIGFGKEIASFTDKHGTVWRLAWLPLGGYVKFMGDENGASVPDADAIAKMSDAERETSFHAKPLWQRAAVVAAGPIANFILAIALLTGIFWALGERVVLPRIEKVMENSAAEAAGFKAGDLILTVNEKPINTFNDLLRITSGSSHETMTFTVERAGKIIALTAMPRMTDVPDGFGGTIKVPRLGLQAPQLPNEWKQQNFGPFEAMSRAVGETFNIAHQTWRYLGKVLLRTESGDQLGGPVRIADAAGKMASLGIVPLINFIAFMSVSIGFANLLPIPLLDGGHLMFYAIEAIRGYPLGERAQEYAFRFGAMVVLFLFLFTSWNDLSVIKSWLGIG